MNAIINGSGEKITGKTLKEIRRKMCEMLKVEGPRWLSAKTENGSRIFVCLYDNQDYIASSDGRIIYRGDK